MIWEKRSISRSCICCLSVWPAGLKRSAVKGLTLCERSFFLINKMIPTDKNIGTNNKLVVARVDTTSEENSISIVFVEV